ncbi:MAG TPA: ChaN family lipoprotein [Albitalea sp.]|nr:ChaN family lipoprotein [Albitalea sp.]
MTDSPFTRMRRAALVVLALACGACSTPERREPWESRLRGDAVVLLGEVHDNPALHALRLAALRRALAAGWRPVIAMEQFDREHQADIERARRERPGDARHLIDLAAPARPGGSAGGWHWDSYRPVVELALRYDLPLIAANLSNPDTTKIVRGGYAAVFDAADIAALGLDRPIAPDWQAAQEHEIDQGHCHALPPASWPRMARAQFARDAMMAATLQAQAQSGRGVVLLAGNGHVRRDLGVPRWMAPAWRDRLMSVGYLEQGDDMPGAGAFDAVVWAPPASRPDPCEGFKRR